MAVIDPNPYGAYEEFVYWLNNLPLWRMGAFAGIAGVLFRIINFKLVSALCFRGMALILVAKLCAWILSKPDHPASRFSAACLCASMELGVLSKMIQEVAGFIPAVPMVVTVIGWAASAAAFAAVVGILVRIFVAMFLN